MPGVGKTTSNNTIKFTGQYRDTDTAANLDYFGARYYSNTIGRFMSPDWAAKPTTVPYAKFGDPQSLNLYSYVENGPINRIDADGHGYAMFDTRNGRGSGGDIEEFIESPDGHSGGVEFVPAVTKVTTTTTTTTATYPGGTKKTISQKTTTTKHTTPQRLGYNTISGGPNSNPWVVQWKLSKKSLSGGWIVQQVEVTDASGQELYNFWEAWQVPAKSQFSKYFPDPRDDTFRRVHLIPSGATAKAQARFYEGLQLPSSFISYNPATLAGELPSTTVNPNLPTKNATAPVGRTWTAP